SDSRLDQADLHPYRGRFYFYIFDETGAVIRHGIRIFILDAECSFAVISMLCQRTLRAGDFPAEKCTGFIGCTRHAESILTVRCQVEIHDLVIEIQCSKGVHTDILIPVEDEDATLVFLRYIVLRNAEFLKGTDHPFRHLTPQFCAFDLYASGQPAPDLAYYHIGVRPYIRCPAYNLARLFSGIHPAYFQPVGLRMLLHRFDIADNEVFY